MTICKLGHLAYQEMNKKIPLLEPIIMGRYRLKNRVIMAPLTRRRATDDFVPTSLMKTYYEQRASAGLIISEATNISRQGTGYLNTPGIYTLEQIEAWKPITQAVHQKGGLIFAQLWHVGRISHSLIQENQKLPVSASAIKASGEIKTPKGHREMEAPRALETEEIPEIVNDYRAASLNAREAGFDGVEIHGANGYLIDQFLHDGSNHRTDHYGGSIENRCRFALEVTQACCDAIGSDRVGIRLSPSGVYKDMIDSQPIKLYEYLIGQLNRFNLVYLHIMEPYIPLDPPERYPKYLKEVTPYFRNVYTGKLITNVDFDYNSGNRVIHEGHADAVAFGKLFISNPDLVERFEKNAPLNSWDKDTFYYGGAKGYIDYPFYNL